MYDGSGLGSFLLRTVRSARSLEIHGQVPLSHIRTSAPFYSLSSFTILIPLNTKPSTKPLNSTS